MSNYIAKMMLFGACPVAILVGTWCLADYSNRPGQEGDIPTQFGEAGWPELLDLEKSMARAEPVLVLFYHPRCPCTQATVRNLARLSTRFSVQPRTIAFAYCPSTEPDNWINTTMTDSLKKLSDIRIVSDRNGNACRRFGVTTSGHFLFYNRDGRLVFSGGITPFRGHEGDCRASTDLVRKVNGHDSDSVHWPVFGCEIVSDRGMQQ